MLTKEEVDSLGKIKNFINIYFDKLDDDFNTADAMAAIFELVKFINITVKDEHSSAFFEVLAERMDTLLDVMGLNALVDEGDLSDEIEAMIEKRQQARKAKDFATADAIRDELLARGIVLEDTREGVKWHKA